MLLPCPDSHPTLFGLFDPSIAPNLLFYSYIPAIVVSLFFGFYVFYKSNHSLKGVYMLCISVTFSLFLINEITQWIAVPAALVGLGWSLAFLFQFLVWFFAINFFYVFLYEKQMPTKGLLILAVLFLPVIVLLPTQLNISYFELSLCEGVVGPLKYYLYAFQIISIAAIMVWGFYNAFFQNKKQRRKILIVTIGTAVFLLVFLFSSVYGELFDIYTITLVGPIGMIIFLGFLTFLIVRYQVFQIKLIGAQALVISLFLLIGAELFFAKTKVNQILILITLFITCVFGWWLVRSVRKEVERKLELENLTKKLKLANGKLKKLDQAKTEFVSIASHQLRSPLTAIKGYLSLVLDGSYGEIPNKAKETLSKIFVSNERIIHLVEDLLNISRIEMGKFVFRFKKNNISSLVDEVVDNMQFLADNKKIELEYKKSKTKIAEFVFDRDKINEVITNLVDNAIKYTPKGKVSVGLKDFKDSVRVIVEDTGIGIKQGDADYIFEKMQRGNKINNVSTEGMGLGLYVGKKIINAHDGKIWVKSKGKGKGSKFVIELSKKFAPEEEVKELKEKEK